MPLLKQYERKKSNGAFESSERSIDKISVLMQYDSCEYGANGRSFFQRGIDAQ